MAKEIPSSTETSTKEIYDLRTLSSQSMMKYVLEIFDLGKDEDKNEERKKRFIELMSKYNQAYIKSKIVYDLSTKNKRERYEMGRAELHNEIMKILRNMSLSLGLTKQQREVVSYLSENRDEVTKMIALYFSQTEQASADNPSEYLKLKEQLSTLSNRTGPEEE